ncbi:MAG: hypothetical protein HY343_07220 [Lentisphaerae bacterium]|nr:hypothetical protein [Lentisphaerota bacterium]
MKKLFACGLCGHIEFNGAPEKCLVCRSPKTAFDEKPDALKKPANPAALSDGDKKHIPVIVVAKQCGLIPDGSCTDVHVKVGQIEHVMKPDHYIRCIDYYVDDRFVSRVWLSPDTCKPAAGLHLAVKSGRVTAVETCNIHGAWMAEAEI